MNVREVLRVKNGEVKSVRPTDTVDVLVRRLRLERVGALVVSDDGKRLLGMVSERDVAGCVADYGARAPEVKVSEIMTAQVHTCSPDDSLTTVARQMTQRRVRHIPAVENGVMIGIVSIGDVVKHRLAEVELEAHVLRDIALAGH